VSQRMYGRPDMRKQDQQRKQDGPYGCQVHSRPRVFRSTGCGVVGVRRSIRRPAAFDHRRAVTATRFALAHFIGSASTPAIMGSSIITKWSGANERVKA
jgi:hypothetical protein